MPPPPDPRAAAVAAHLAKRAQQRAQRSDILKKIATARNSKVIAYVTANRGILGAQVGLDAIRIFREHLGNIGKSKKLDLLLITRGGHTLTPPRLMSLIREFAEEVSVLVPYMSHSAGTLIALGADEIVMGAMGELGPVDPSVSNQFNPVLSTEDIQGTAPKPRPRIPISVEDVISYVNFAKGHSKLDAAGMATAFSALTNLVHPLALGNILRNHNLIRHLARRLLLMHMDEAEDKEKLDGIVRTLTEELYAHDNLITRDEAPKIGLNVVEPTDEVEQMLWDLYKIYEGFFGIDQAINLAAELGTEKTKYLCYDVAAIESENLLHSFCIRAMASRKGATEFDLNAESQIWES
jgi:hypothetical protein